MAKVNGPLFSLEASGKLGNALVYGKWKGRPTVREYVTPANPRTLDQINQRLAISLTTYLWVNGYSLEGAWDALATAASISPFNAFTRFNVERIKAGLPPLISPTATPNENTGEVTSIDYLINRRNVDGHSNIQDPDEQLQLTIITASPVEVDSQRSGRIVAFGASQLVTGTSYVLPWRITRLPTGDYYLSANTYALATGYGSWLTPELITID